MCIGIDLAKNVCALHGLDEAGKPALVRPAVPRAKLLQAIAALPFGLWAWPATMPSGTAWLNLAGLALLCTGVAYILYFRLMARVGPTKAVTVTFLIPVFAVLWGALFLGEALTLAMAGGGALILAGTALALGLWPRR